MTGTGVCVLTVEVAPFCPKHLPRKGVRKGRYTNKNKDKQAHKWEATCFLVRSTP